MAAKKKPARKAPAKKAAKKAPGKKAQPKKAPAKKAAKKAPAKKVPAKKAVAGKVAAKKAPAKKVAAKRPPAPPVVSPVTDKGPSAAAEPAPRPVPEPVNDTNAKVGDLAPDFTLTADDDAVVTLGDLRGRNVVVYFYPRDNTPGCTIEARDFSLLGNEFAAKNAVVFGVSTDDLKSHRHFKSTCDLSVTLLADPDKVAHEAYGVWREKNMYGRKTMGTVRSTFLIGEDGRVRKVWPKVKVEDHALEVLNSL